MVMLGYQAASAQSRLMKAVSHLDVLMVLIAGNTGYRLIISIDTHKGILLEFGQIVYVDCEKEWKRTEPWERPSLTVPEGPMESYTRILAVRFMKQEDSLSVERRGTPIFDIFIRNPERQTLSYARLKSKIVAMLRRLWVD